MIARDRDDGVRRHPHRDRSAAARSQSDQAPEAALQRAAARRQVLPLHPDRHRPRVARHLQASRRAHAQGRLFRPLRLGAARSSAPSTRCSGRSCCAPARTRVFEAARGPACCTRSSAAPRPAPARSRSDDYARAGRRGDGFPLRQEPEGAGRSAPRRCSDAPRSSTSSAPRVCAIASRRCRHVQAHQGINPQTVDEADVFAIAPGGRPDLRPGVLLPRRPELGQPRLFPARPIRALERSEVLEPFLAPVLRRQPVPRMILLAHDVEEQRAAGRGAVDQGRPQGRDLRAAARREARPGRPCAAERARGARPPARRERHPGAAARRRRRDLRPRRRRRAASRSTTTPTSWAPTRSAPWSSPGRKASSRSQYRKFNIRSTDITPGDDFGMMREVMTRRFSRLLKETRKRPQPPSRRRRDDDAGHARLARRRPDRRRRRASSTAVRAVLAELGMPSDVIARSASPRAPIATPGASASSSPGRDRLHAAARATRCSTSCSGCATRRTASPSARTARGARRRSAQPARRDRRHRAQPQARPAAAFRLRQGGRRAPPWRIFCPSKASRRSIARLVVQPFPRELTSDV